jgi:CDP-glucose 4,6-dehydratase
MPFDDIYRGKRVLVTGHTGFKGAWLTEWLVHLGAEVAGLALVPPTQPALFDQLSLASRSRHLLGDIRDLAVVEAAVQRIQPDFVFHLAAQSLVRLSYAQPVETYATNVMGTANVLEAVRRASRPCSVIVVTTDKCYENKEWVHSYREDDPMGGYDPYSSSKGAAELVVSAYRRSYFSSPDSLVRLASARAGNVLGGGDWALDRIVPDCIRSLQQGKPIVVRNQAATRPWQHVLEPLSGYLWLGACLMQAGHGTCPAVRNPLLSSLTSAFNFGPALTSNRSVAKLVEEVLQYWPEGKWEDGREGRSADLHEANLLNLSTDKAFHLLSWQPVWNFEATVRRTITWYREAARGVPIPWLTQDDIAAYVAEAQAGGRLWAA